MTFRCSFSHLEMMSMKRPRSDMKVGQDFDSSACAKTDSFSAEIGVARASAVAATAGATGPSVEAATGVTAASEDEAAAPAANESLSFDSLSFDSAGAGATGAAAVNGASGEG